VSSRVRGAARSTIDPGTNETEWNVDRTAPSAHAHRTPKRLVPAIAATALVVVVVAAVYWWWPRSASTPPAPPATVAAPPAAMAPATTAAAASLLDAAEGSLRARQYRAALGAAEDALRADPANARAQAIRNEAASMLRRFDEAMSTTRARLAVGDMRGAARALDEARAIDPVGPAVADLSTILADRLKGASGAARDEAPRQRLAPPAAAPSQSVVPAPVPNPPPAPTQPDAPAARESAPGIPTSPAVPPPTRAEPPEVPAAIVKPTVPLAPAIVERAPSSAPVPAAEDDETAIRRVVATYARAIETKDLALFRSVKPNLGAEEERRIQQGFRAVASQQVRITILSIDRRGDRATLRLRRQDVIDVGGRRQSPESQQAMTLAKSNGTWTILEIGR
jgi:hypothetical protein